MISPVRGNDLPALKRWAARIQGLPDLRRAISYRISQVVAPALVEEGFRERRDPYGKSWKPAKDGHLPQLERSGKLREGYSFSARSTGDGVTLTIRNSATRTRPSGTASYGAFLQAGTASMEARKQAPDERGLPEAWVRRIVEAYQETYSRHLREGRL